MLDGDYQALQKSQGKRRSDNVKLNMECSCKIAI